MSELASAESLFPLDLREACGSRHNKMIKGQVQQKHVPAELQQLVAPHIDSFDYFIGEGLEEVVARLEPTQVCTRPFMHAGLMQ